MNFEVVVTCAVTGAGDTVDKSPHVPVTPKEVAEAALEAAKAGASAAHIHSKAGDLAAQDGERGLIASDLLPYIRSLVNP